MMDPVVQKGSGDHQNERCSDGISYAIDVRDLKQVG